MKLKTITDVETTEDCIVILNEYKPSKWKRKIKFNIDVGDPEYRTATSVRVFSDGVDTLSILQTDCGAFLANIDLSLFRPLIKEIQKVAKNYYTYDYGDVFLNPWTKDIWVSGGDGGICYSPLSATKIAEKLRTDDNFHDEFWRSDETNFEDLIPEINSTIFEAECSPPMDESELAEEESEWNKETELRWIHVATCIDLGNYEIY